MRIPSAISIAAISLAVATSSYAAIGNPPLPSFQIANGVRYLTGGVGEWERSQIESVADRYNLKLSFAEQRGAYLGDVDVRIANASGDVVLEAKSDGPWFFAALPDGIYDVRVSDHGETFERRVDVRRGELATAHFTWPTEMRSRFD